MINNNLSPINLQIPVNRNPSYTSTYKYPKYPNNQNKNLQNLQFTFSNIPLIASITSSPLQSKNNIHNSLFQQDNRALYRNNNGFSITNKHSQSKRMILQNAPFINWSHKQAVISTKPCFKSDQLYIRNQTSTKRQIDGQLQEIRLQLNKLKKHVQKVQNNVQKNQIKTDQLQELKNIQNLRLSFNSNQKTNKQQKDEQRKFIATDRRESNKLNNKQYNQKIDYIFKKLNQLSFHFHSADKNPNNNQSKLKKKKRNEGQRLLREKTLKDQQNQVLRLQYSKLHKKMVKIIEVNSLLQQQINQKSISNLNKLSQIQKLKQMIAFRDQKNQKMQKTYQKMIQSLNKKITNKDIELRRLNLKQNSFLTKKNEERNIGNTSTPIKLDKKQFSLNLKMIDQEIDPDLESMSQSCQLQHKNTKELTIYLAKLLKIHSFDIQQCSVEEILLKVISQLKQKQYFTIFQNYREIVNLFDVSIDEPDHFKNLKRQINLFRDDIKLLFNKLEEVNQQKSVLMEKNCTLKSELEKYKLKFRQIMKKQNNKQVKQINNSHEIQAYNSLNSIANTKETQMSPVFDQRISKQ